MKGYEEISVAFWVLIGVIILAALIVIAYLMLGSLAQIDTTVV